MDSTPTDRLRGRADELRRLDAELRRVLAGEGRAVTLRGEPGIGKTRLIEAFLEGTDCARLVLTCTGDRRAEPYHAVGPALADRFGDEAGLLAEVAALGLSGGSVGSVLAGVLAGENESGPRPGRALLSLARAMARKAPLVVVFENAQDVDAAAASLLIGFAAMAQTRPVLLLVTHRPGYEPPFEPTVRLELGRLARRDMIALLEASMPPNAHGQLGELLVRANGVPLFGELLASRGLSGVSEALLERLHLSRSEREALGDCAVHGREMAEDVVPPEVRARLITTGLLAASRDDSGGRLAFRHGLIRRAAYASVPPDRRAALHARCAAALSATDEPEQVADHLVRAGRQNEAVPLFLRAGERAVAASADWEAVDHFERALDLIPEDSDPARELPLVMKLGATLNTVRGFGAAEVERVFRRARALCRRVGSDLAFAAHRGLWGFHVARGELDTARQDATMIRHHARRVDSSFARIAAGHATGVGYLFEGQPAKARPYIETVLHEEQTGILPTAAVYGIDPSSALRAYLSWTLQALGDASAEDVRDESIALAERGDHVFSLCFALAFAAVFDARAGQVTEAESMAKRAADECGKHGFGMMLGLSRAVLGWARSHDDPDNGLEVLRGGIAGYHESGARISGPFLLGLLADTLGRLGRFDEALVAVDQGLEDGRARGEAWTESDLLLVRGVLLDDQSVLREALRQAELRPSAAIARRVRAVLA